MLILPKRRIAPLSFMVTLCCETFSMQTITLYINTPIQNIPSRGRLVLSWISKLFWLSNSPFSPKVEEGFATKAERRLASRLNALVEASQPKETECGVQDVGDSELLAPANIAGSGISTGREESHEVIRYLWLSLDKASRQVSNMVHLTSLEATVPLQKVF